MTNPHCRDLPEQIANNHTDFAPLYHDTMETLHNLFDPTTEKNMRLVNATMSAKAMDLSEAIYRLQDKRSYSTDLVTNKSGNCITLSYEIEWNISFRDNMKNTRYFIPIITIQIVRIEFPKNSSSIFLESRIIVAEFSCLLVRVGKTLVGKDSEVRVFEAPCTGVFTNEDKPCAFLKQQWGKTIILLGALFCALLGAKQEVHTISNESRRIYAQYFDDYKSAVDGDHFELSSSDVLIEHVNQKLKTIFDAISADQATDQATDSLRYSNMYVVEWGSQC